MNLRRFRCWFGVHSFGLPLAGIERIYCRCIECGAQSAWVDVERGKLAMQQPSDTARARLRVFKGRLEQRRMRFLG